MTTELQVLQRAAVYEEANNAFATDHSGTPSDFLDVPFQEGTATLSLDKVPLDPKLAVQYRTDAAKIVLGPSAATLQLTIPCFGTGISANASTASATSASNALLRMIKAVMGGMRGGDQGSLVVASPSPTTTAFAVTSTEGSQFTAGSAVGLLRSSDSALEVRELKSVSTDTLTLKIALSNAPATSDVVYNSTTGYITEDPNTSLQFIVEGAEQSDRWLLMGGQCTAMTLNLPINELPTMTFSFEFADWANLSAQAITIATYSNFQPLYVYGEFNAQATGTSTRNIVDVQSITYEPSLKFMKVMSPSGTNGVRKFKAIRELPMARVKFTAIYEDLTWFNVRDARTDYHFGFQCGNVPGETLYFSCPAAQVETVQRADNDGLAGQEVTARARVDSDATDTTTEIRRSCFRMHWL